MTDKNIITLAYSKSPKVSRRTTFQDELQAVVSARASRTNAGRYSFLDDLDDDEDDFLKQLGSRRSRASAFKTGRSKAKINDFHLSDDESKPGATKKRVSFLKTQRGGSPSDRQSAGEAPRSDPPDPADPDDPHDPAAGRTPSPSAGFSGEDWTEGSGADHASLRSTSLSGQTSDGSGRAPRSPLTLPSDDGAAADAARSTSPPEDSPEERASAEDEERRSSPSPKLRAGADTPSTDSAAGRPAPRPRPRPRARLHGAGPRAVEEVPADPESSQSLHSTCTGSLTHPTPVPPVDVDDAAPVDRDPLMDGVPLMDRVSLEDHSSHGSEGDGTTSPSSRSVSLPRSERYSLTRTTVDSASLDRRSSEDSREREAKYSSSFDEFQKDLEEQLDPARHRHSNGNVFDSRPSTSLNGSSGRSRSACSSVVESRYLGRLKVLDHSSAPGQPPLDAGDSLRAEVYQDWLRKKQETSKGREQQRKKEDSLKEEKQKAAESDKRENALASFEAWKEKKSETLKAKAREKEALLRRQQKAAEELQEKKQMALEVFEKWKKGHDELLRVKTRKQKEAEDKLKEKKMEKDEERKTNSKYAISDWKERKTRMCEKVLMERKKSKRIAEEERSGKEERDQMALDMYDTWLTRKEREQRRQKEERRIQSILQDTPPPPWSPPNKTVPFGK